MNKFSSKIIDYRIAVICNIPLLLIPLIVLLFWRLGAYSNDDGYNVTMIVAYVGGVYILPSFVISIFLLARAARERRKNSNEFSKLSVIYGISASIILGSWLLLMEPTW